MGSYQVTDVETGVSITNNSSGFRTVDGAIKKAKEMVAFAKPEFLQKRFGEYKQRVEMLEKSSTPSKDRIVEPTEATKPVQGASVSKEPYEMTKDELITKQQLQIEKYKEMLEVNKELKTYRICKCYSIG